MPDPVSQSKTFRLEYVCTQVEIEEAQSLFLRKQLGRGSKRLTQTVLIFLLIGMLLALYFRLGQIFSAKSLPYVYGTVLAGCIGFVFWKRLNPKRRGVARVEMSESGVAFLGEDSSSTNMPWSAFGDLLQSPKLFALRDRQKGMVYILPKRAFPDEASQEWFRALAQSRQAPENVASVESVPEIASADQIHLNFRLGFRDCIARTVASSKVAAMVLAVLLLLVGATAFLFVNPPPNAVNSPTKVLFVFMIPFWAVMVPFLYLIVALATWYELRKYLGPQEVVLSAKSICVTGSDRDSTLSWSTYPSYKETRRLFIMWNPRSGAWIMIPKRAFASKDDEQCCRILLGSNSRPARWYFG